MQNNKFNLFIFLAAALIFTSSSAYAANDGNISINKTVANASSGSGYESTVSAQSGQTVDYKIVIEAVNGSVIGINITDIVPDGIGNVRDLKLNGNEVDGDLTEGLNIAALDEGESATITYSATVYDNGHDETSLTNTATAWVNGETTASDATVNVYSDSIQDATAVSTGFDNNSAAAGIAGLFGMLLIAGFMLKKNLIG